MDTGIGWDVIPEAEGRKPQLVLVSGRALKIGLIIMKLNSVVA